MTDDLNKLQDVYTVTRPVVHIDDNFEDRNNEQLDEYSNDTQKSHQIIINYDPVINIFNNLKNHISTIIKIPNMIYHIDKSSIYAGISNMARPSIYGLYVGIPMGYLGGMSILYADHHSLEKLYYWMPFYITTGVTVGAIGGATVGAIGGATVGIISGACGGILHYK
jgi:hypothetical protein